MTNIEILKRLYKDYTSKFLKKILLAVFFSIIVATSTSAIAWLLDPAIKKLFIEKDQTLIFIIPLAIIISFATKGISLYFAKVILVGVAEEVKKILQFEMLSSFIKFIQRWFNFNWFIGCNVLPKLETFINCNYYDSAGFNSSKTTWEKNGKSYN